MKFIIKNLLIAFLITQLLTSCDPNEVVPHQNSGANDTTTVGGGSTGGGDDEDPLR